MRVGLQREERLVNEGEPVGGERFVSRGGGGSVELIGDEGVPVVIGSRIRLKPIDPPLFYETDVSGNFRNHAMIPAVSASSPPQVRRLRVGILVSFS